MGSTGWRGRGRATLEKRVRNEPVSVHRDWLSYWPAVWLSLLAWLAGGPKALAEGGKMVVEKTEYAGWKNNLRISNGEAELIATLDVGPRIISYRLTSGKNVFKEYADQLGKAGESEWMIRGGHRLWAALRSRANLCTR